jgi:serine/threonine protein kinase
MTGADARLTAALEGRYSILRMIGQGGMATVYLAEDVRHERRVALKVLRPELAAVVGAERFLAEIKTTANLQHPHILPLHDSGEAGGSVFYVMPYVEGETLRDRLDREHQLPVEDATRIASEILSALDYAHRHGVIHRDIKPENILLHDGQALVADFGVALAVTSAGTEARMTETGMSLGTPSYMSPEQAMGERDISARSDVYAVGCLLYEMLIGEPPFTGPTAQAIIARLLTGEPKPMGEQRKTIPPNVEAAVLKALSRLPADRHRSAADFADALSRRDSPATASVPITTPSTSRSVASWRHPLVLGSLAVAASSVGLAAWALAGRGATDSAPVVRFDATHPDTDQLGSEYDPIAISPDGRTIAVTVSRNGQPQIHIRRIGEVEMRPVPGTEGGASPTFTEDGNWIVFSNGPAFYKVPLSGGTPTKVADVPWNQAVASYFPDGSIIVGSYSSVSIYRLAGEGAALEELTRADSTRGELNHRRPIALPDGEHVLFDISRADGYHAALLSLSTGEWTDLGLGVAQGTVYSAGYLIYPQANRVVAVPFDLGAARVTGTPVVIDSVSSSSSVPHQVWELAASPNGTIIYVSGPGGSESLDLIWVDRNGQVTPTGLPRGEWDQPRLSPDGQRIVAQSTNGALDLVRVNSGQRSRLAQPQAQLPEWDPSGQRIAYGDGASGLWLVPADQSSPPERIVEANVWPYSWSPDGNAIAVYEVDPVTARNILVARRLENDWQIEDLLATNANERSPAISPNGRWLAYASDESGQDEIYVVSFNTGEDKRLVSSNGGREPAWSSDGRELYYRRGREIFAVPIGDGPLFSPGTPVTLFEVEASTTEGATGERDWDVSPDGERFLFTRSPRRVSPFSLRVIVNFPEALASTSR